MIFSNNTLEQLVERKPSNKEELLAIDGFGKVKVDNYGDEIEKLRLIIMEMKY